MFRRKGRELKESFQSWSKQFSTQDIFILVFIMLMVSVRIIYQTQAIGCKIGELGDELFLWYRFKYFYIELYSGRLPIYYNYTFYGLGFGSSFFYGHYIFYLLLPAYWLGGVNGFFFSYYFLILVCAYFFSRALMRRCGVKHDRFIAFLFITSSYFTTTYFTNTMISCLLAMVCSFLFLAYCIDFFRDGKNGFKATCVFFIIVGQHTITSVIALACCIVVFAYYYRSYRIRSYLWFLVANGISVAYFVLNLLYHYESDFLVKDINEQFASLDYYLSNNIDSFLRFSAPESVVAPMGIGAYFTITLFIFLTGWSLYRIVTGETKFKERLILYICIVLMGISNFYVFLYLEEHTVVFFGQFPYRYLLFVYLYVFVFATKGHDFYKWVYPVLIVISVVSTLIFSHGISGKPDEYVDSYRYIGNGEYLTSKCINFEESSKFYNEHIGYVTNQNGEKFDLNTGVMKSEGSSDFDMYKEWEDNDIPFKTTGIMSAEGTFKKGDTLIFPKIYYKGFTSDYGEVTVTDHQLCQLTVAEDTNVVNLYYTHPKWLWIVCLVSNIWFILLFVGIIFRLKYIELLESLNGISKEKTWSQIKVSYL